MDELTAEQFAQRAFDLNLLDERQLQRVWADFGTQDIPVEEFRQHVLRQGLMTSYQIDRMLRGERGGFYYGDYKILYQIGAGSFARVFRADHQETGQPVAVKVLRQRNAENPRDTEMFLREGRMGMGLDHPNIVPIYEVVAKRPLYFLVMEFLEGHTLREFMRTRKKLEPREAVNLMNDVCAGLAFAFGRDITHRDLSMSNVFITSDAVAKVVDFGLAAVGGSVDETPNPRTIDYVALERATGVGRDDTRSDIYFAGCMLYHMLAGEPGLVEAHDRIARLSVQRFREVIPLAEFDESLPRCVTRIVDKAMAFDAQLRYQKPGEMLADLQLVARWLADPEKYGDEIGLVDEAPRTVVMVVESNEKMQNLLREGLSKCGYRVLVISRPEMALRRFEENANVADCVLISTAELGEDALEAFNRLGHDLATRDLPAILLLGEDHHDWKDKANLSQRRLTLDMPLRFRMLRDTLGKLITL